MGSKTPAKDAAEPQDELVVALPPEILAMMAASEASMAEAETETEDAPEADEAALALAPEAEVEAEAEVVAEDAGAEPSALDAEMALLLASVGAGPAVSASEPEPAGPVEPVEGETTLTLPAVLDLTAAGALHQTLLSHRGAPLALDAGEVKRLGGQCLQLLLSAGRTWAADGVPIRLGGASDAFERDLALMGLDREALFQREAA